MGWGFGVSFGGFTDSWFESGQQPATVRRETEGWVVKESLLQGSGDLGRLSSASQLGLGSSLSLRQSSLGQALRVGEGPVGCGDLLAIFVNVHTREG